jgi:toxin-antitoxin system PIN domain toxin
MRAPASMRCVDVNILVFAHRPEAPSHEHYRAWLDEARTAHEPLGLADPVLAGFLRVVTHPRVFREPTPLSIALAFLDALLGSPAAMRIAPGDRHWSIFTDLCRRVEATGNVVPDAYLAALAIESGATWVTADRGFGRFRELRWQHPFEA